MRRTRWIIVAVAVLGGSIAGVPGSSGDPPALPRTVQAAALAIPSEQDPQDWAQRTRFDRVWAGQVQVDGVANASATCDACTADAVTVQVVYARHATSLRTHNVAAAWASCTGCDATAVALQVVVVAGAVTNLQAANRALAVNAGCAGCGASALAVQFVVVAPAHHTLSPTARWQLGTLRDRLAGQLAAGPAPAVRASSTRADSAAPAPDTGVDATVAELQGLLTDDLQPRTVTVKVSRDVP